VSRSTLTLKSLFSKQVRRQETVAGDNDSDRRAGSGSSGRVSGSNQREAVVVPWEISPSWYPSLNPTLWLTLPTVSGDFR